MSIKRPDIVYRNKVLKFDPIRKRMKVWNVSYHKVAFLLTLWDLEGKNMNGGMTYCLNVWNKRFPSNKLTYRKMTYFIYQWEKFRKEMDAKYNVG